MHSTQRGDMHMINSYIVVDVNEETLLASLGRAKLRTDRANGSVVIHENFNKTLKFLSKYIYSCAFYDSIKNDHRDIEIEEDTLMDLYICAGDYFVPIIKMFLSEYLKTNDTIDIQNFIRFNLRNLDKDMKNEIVEAAAILKVEALQDSSPEGEAKRQYLESLSQIHLNYDKMVEDLLEIRESRGDDVYPLDQVFICVSEKGTVVFEAEDGTEIDVSEVDGRMREQHAYFFDSVRDEREKQLGVIVLRFVAMLGALNLKRVHVDKKVSVFIVGVLLGLLTKFEQDGLLACNMNIQFY